jgi:hypothetical protein
MVGVSVKAFINLSNKLGPSNISLMGSFSPLPPLPAFLIEIPKFGMKNAAVLKSPNSEPESIYLATRIQMRVNRSHRFNLFILLFMFPKG